MPNRVDLFTMLMRDKKTVYLVVREEGVVNNSWVIKLIKSRFSARFKSKSALFPNSRCDWAVTNRRSTTRFVLVLPSCSQNEIRIGPNLSNANQFWRERVYFLPRYTNSLISLLSTTSNACFVRVKRKFALVRRLIEFQRPRLQCCNVGQKRLQVESRSERPAIFQRYAAYLFGKPSLSNRTRYLHCDSTYRSFENVTGQFSKWYLRKSINCWYWRFPAYFSLEKLFRRLFEWSDIFVFGYEW